MNVQINYFRIFLVLGASTLSLAQTPPPKEITLGFDGLADLASNVDDFGVKFTGATVLACGGALNCVPFPPFSGRNVIYDQPGFGGVITATFDPLVTGPVSQVSARITGNRNITMTAFDKDGLVIDSKQTGGPNYIGSGGGLSPNILLTVKSPTTTTIRKVTFHDSGNTYTVDDFTFTTRNRLVVLDPGHGQILGTDGVLHYQRPPSPTYGLREDNLTLDIAASADFKLLTDGQYISVKTRSGFKAPFAPTGCGADRAKPYDRCSIDNMKRREWAEKIEADVFVSIHTNGSDTTRFKNGAWAYYCSATNKSNLLAQNLLSEMGSLGLATSGVFRQGVAQTCWDVIDTSSYIGGYAEVGSPTNTFILPIGGTTDEERLNSSTFRSNAGKGIASAIQNFIKDNLEK